MIQMKTLLVVADNTGARSASVIGVLNAKGKLAAQIGDIVRVNIKESTPEAAVKKGQKAKGVIVRTKARIRRPDGTYVRFDTNAVVLIDDAVRRNVAERARARTFGSHHYSSSLSTHHPNNSDS